MKKLFLVIGLALTVGTASAQNHLVQSFMNAQSLCVSNTICVTNLLAYGYVTAAAGTNNLLTVYTNLAGSQVIVSTSFGTDVNLLKDISVLPQKAPIQSVWTNAATAVQAGPYEGSIFIRIKGQSGANSAVVFNFVPVPDGVNGDYVSGDLISVSVTANTTTEVQKLSPLDISKLIGCKALRCISITNGDTDATSRVDVLECAYVAFVP